MKYTYSFEKLTVWQDSKNLSILIYKISSFFPNEEKFGLVSQMRRSSVSVCSNIAEGSSRMSNKDQAHFYNMAYSSLIELLNQCIIARELLFLDGNNYFVIRKEIENISGKIGGLRNSILKSKS